MEVLRYPLTRILLAMIAGICVGRFYNVSTEGLVYLLLSTVVLGIILLVVSKRSYFIQLFYGVVVLTIFSLIGLMLMTMRNMEQYSDLLKRAISQPSIMQIIPHRQLKPTAYKKRWVAQITELNGSDIDAEILISADRNSDFTLSPDSIYTYYGHLTGLPKSLNRGGFDYGRYLADQNILLTAKAKSLVLVESSEREWSWQDLVFTPGPTAWSHIRENVISHIDQLPYGERQAAMVKALIIGQRQSLDPEVEQSFRDAGVIHILALSGLHVGIILLILQFITRPLKRSKTGRIIQTITILICIWSFAFLSGLSPSIFRSVVMFSFVAVGQGIGRPKLTLMSVLTSAFLLLLINPAMLFQVGFQLSYAAVICIITMQPILSPYYQPKFWIDKYLWGVLTVTVTAQLGVAPISMYYFHQFPGIFLVSNLALLPILPLIMGGIILTVVFALIGSIWLWFTEMMNTVLFWVIEIVSYLGGLKFMVIDDIFLKLSEVVLIYVCLFIAVYIFRYPSAIRWRNGLTISIIAVFFILVIPAFDQSNEILIQHRTGASVLSVNERNREVVAFAKADSAFQNSLNRSYTDLKTAVSSKRLSINSLDSLPLRWNVEGIEITRITKEGIYVPTKTEVLWLTFSPKVHLGRVISQMRPELIIVDGSNYPSAVAQWQNTAKAYDVQLIYTRRVGDIDLSNPATYIQNPADKPPSAPLL